MVFFNFDGCHKQQWMGNKYSIMLVSREPVGAGIFEAVSNQCGPYEAEDNRRSKAHAYPSVKGRRGWQTVLVEIFGTSPAIRRCINSARR